MWAWMRVPAVLLASAFSAIWSGAQDAPQRARVSEAAARHAMSLGTERGYRDAINHLREALSQTDEGDQLAEAARLHLQIGSLWNRLVLTDSALPPLARALRLVEMAEDSTLQVETLAEIGRAYGWNGDTDSALAAFARAETTAGKLGPATARELKVHFQDIARQWELAVAQALRRDDPARISSLLGVMHTARAFAAWRGTPLAEQRATVQVAHAFRLLERSDSALHWGRKATSLSRRVGDTEQIVRSLMYLESDFASANAPDSAAEIRRIREEMWRGHSRVSALLAVANSMARQHRDSSLVMLERAVVSSGQLGLVDLEQTARRLLGKALLAYGRPDSASAVARVLLQNSLPLGNPIHRSLSLVLLADTEVERGNVDRGREFLLDALERLRDGESPLEQSGGLRQVSRLFVATADPDSAISAARAAHDLIVTEAQRLRAELRAGHHPLYTDPAAPQALDEVREMETAYSRRMMTDLFEATTAWGVRLREAGLVDSSRTLMHQAVALHLEWQLERRLMVSAQMQLGYIEAQADRLDSAIEHFAVALAISREIGDRGGEAVLLQLLGMTYLSMGEVAHARGTAHLDSAASASRRLAAEQLDDANRVGIGEQMLPVLDRWVERRFDDYDRARSPQSAALSLAASDRSRAQGTLALMGTINSTSPSLLGEGERLIRLAARTRATIVAYYLTDRRLMGWVVRPGTGVRVFRMSVDQRELQSLVSRYRLLLGVDNRDSRQGESREGVPELERGRVRVSARQEESESDVRSELARAIFPTGFDSLLVSTRELVIVPHGSLNLVPFAALTLPGDSVPLGIRFAIRATPSLAILDAIEMRNASRTGASKARHARALVVSDPSMPFVRDAMGRRVRLASLPGARHEGAYVARRLGAVDLSGRDASEAVVRNRLSTASIVHLATHAFAYSSDSRSGESFVALAPSGEEDGLMTVGELTNDVGAPLQAALVVLSACQTGLGDLKRSEGTIGLQRAFLARGAHSVLASLWSVSDRATSLLMRRFYTHWLDDRDRPTKAEALRRAQSDVRTTIGFEHPRYWAAFQLTGAR